MWHINSISVQTGAQTQIFGGSGNTMHVCALGERLGPQGAMYVISVAGVGAISLQDVGAIGGPGAWAIRVNNSDTYVYYNGEGQLTLSITEAGQVTINGGVNVVTTQLLMSMQDVNNLIPFMFTMVAQSTALQQQWKNNAMQTLYMMGLPETCMLNMDTRCCMQLMDFLQSVTFPSGFLLAPEHALVSAEAVASRSFDRLAATHEALGGWWGCTLCQVGLAAATAAIVAITLVVIGVAAPEAGLVAALAATGPVTWLAGVLGVSAVTIAQISITAAIAGAAKLVDRIVEGLCQAMGACSAQQVLFAPSSTPAPL